MNALRGHSLSVHVYQANIPPMVRYVYLVQVEHTPWVPLMISPLCLALTALQGITAPPPRKLHVHQVSILVATTLNAPDV